MSGSVKRDTLPLCSLLTSIDKGEKFVALVARSAKKLRCKIRKNKDVEAGRVRV